MTKKYRIRRRVSFPLIAALVLWLVSATALCRSAESAMQLLGRRGDLAVSILRAQLGGGGREEELPAAVAMVISQSPLLLSGRDAVLALRRSAEEDTGDDALPSPSKDAPSIPVPEAADPPEIPLVIVDNGVSARTLVPTSPEGYTIIGSTYIDNRSDRELDPAALSSTPAAVLTGGGLPEVLIVHTHGSEAYTMPPGEEYVPSGDCRTVDTSCSVVRVGDEIAAILTAAGISVVHDRTLHDYPRYSGAYERSLAAVEEHLARHPTISLVLDIHRDAISDSSGNMYKVVSTDAGVNAAQMAFVIGTDGGGLYHPDWQKNLSLAVAVQNTVAADYPTLMRPITVRNSRYNQHMTPGSLLVEMGAAGNSLDEALLSARILARAILDTMLIQPPKPLPVSAVN